MGIIFFVRNEGFCGFLRFQAYLGQDGFQEAFWRDLGSVWAPLGAPFWGHFGVGGTIFFEENLRFLKISCAFGLMPLKRASGKEDAPKTENKKRQKSHISDSLPDPLGTL